MSYSTTLRAFAMRGLRFSALIFTVSALLLASTIGGLLSLLDSTQALPASASAAVSFTFDDGFESTRTQAAPILAAHGIAGTSYVATKCIGYKTTPNDCQADRDGVYLNWQEVQQLRSIYGWEIGSHTYSHPYLATSDPIDQPSPITAAQVETELTRSKSDLAAQGIQATSFATPYGDYNTGTLSAIAKHYQSHRGFADTGYNSWPYSDYYLKVQQVQMGVSVAQVKSYIDHAAATNQWLILVFHDIAQQPSQNIFDYEYGSSQLNEIAAYAKQKNLRTPTVSQELYTGNTNLVPNGSFTQGLGGGWTTNVPTLISPAPSGNGSYPETGSAILLRSSTQQTNYLFSPKVAVTSADTYLIKQYLRTTSLQGGQIAFYIDEYDAAGNWISGQYKATERTLFTSVIGFPYTPSSGTVATAALQIIVTASSNTIAYLDSVNWISATGSIAPPPATNLVPNATFAAGISQGWSTDAPVSITAVANNGAPTSPANAIQLRGQAGRNNHLFSPLITINSTLAYSFSYYSNTSQASSGALALYIDEYDAANNWISGQYKGPAASGTGINGLSYTPSSAQVVRVRLQFIMQSGSTGSAYLDEVSLRQN